MAHMILLVVNGVCLSFLYRQPSDAVGLAHIPANHSIKKLAAQLDKALLFYTTKVNLYI